MVTSQEYLILMHLQKGYSITPLEALTKYGCFRLSARIHGLRKKGYAIHMRLTDNVYGSHHAIYSLAGAEQCKKT